MLLGYRIIFFIALHIVDSWDVLSVFPRLQSSLLTAWICAEGTARIANKGLWYCRPPELVNVSEGKVAFQYP